MSISGTRSAARRHPRGGEDDRQPRTGRAPAPTPQPQRRGLAEADQQRDQPARQQRGGEPVDPAGRAAGDSGRKRWAATAAAVTTTSGIQKSQRQPSTLDDRAGEHDRRGRRRRRSAPEMPPIAPATSRGRELVADDPEGEREEPPPRPWSTRAAISTPTFGASAAISEPTARAVRASSSVRYLPAMSPTRPRSGVEDRRGEQVGGQDPGHGALRGVQLVLDRRQHRE